MSEQIIEPRDSQLAAEWLLIMERLRVTDLAGWIAQFRRGDRASNPDWRSWEAIARRILEETRVTVSANGLRARWSDPVDAVLARGSGQPDVPTQQINAVGSTGPGGSSGSDDPPGTTSAPAVATP